MHKNNHARAKPLISICHTEWNETSQSITKLQFWYKMTSFSLKKKQLVSECRQNVNNWLLLECGQRDYDMLYLFSSFFFKP